MHDAFYNHVLSPKFQRIFPKNFEDTTSLKQQYRSILVLNGEIPDASFFTKNLPIIAVDGAANQLLSMGIQPDLVIGDLDSINPIILLFNDFAALREGRAESKSRRALSNNAGKFISEEYICTNLNIIHTPDQDYCDFYKAVEHLTAIKLLPSIIVGMGGGVIDHILQNINIFLSTDSIFYAPPIVGHILQPGIAKFFSLKKNTKISLLGIPTAQISTKGLKWELYSNTLTFPGMNSCFNRSLSEDISLEIHTGTCLAMIYLEVEDDTAT